MVLAVSTFKADAACVNPPPMGPDAVRAFLAAPGNLLSANPSGGAALISAVRGLATSDVAAVAAIGTILASANAEQSAAIGTALGQAANACQRSEAATTQAIRAIIATADKASVTTAFSAVAGDVRTAAVAPGGGAAGGSIGAGGGNGGSGLSGLGLVPNAGVGFSDGRPVTLTILNASSSINPGTGSNINVTARRTFAASPSR